jgi:hypothetical protein
MFSFIEPPIVIDFMDPHIFLLGIAFLTIIAAYCAMLSKDLLAIFIAGMAFICYAFLFNLFFRLIYQLDINFVTVITLGECGIIGLFMLLKLYRAWTGDWRKMKKGQFKVKPS